MGVAQRLDLRDGRQDAPVDDLRRAAALYAEGLTRAEERAARRSQRSGEEQNKDETPVTVALSLTRLLLTRPEAIDDFDATRAVVARAAALAGDDGGWVATLDRRRGWFQAHRAAHAAGAPAEAWLRLADEHLALRAAEPQASHLNAVAKALRAAADLGHPGAPLALGKVQLERGAGAEAARWLTIAADGGSLEAASLLAELLVDGRPVPPDDLVRARALADVAATSTDDAVAARARAVQATLEGR